MNKGNKNIFDETIDTLTNDVKILTEKYHNFLNNGKHKEAIDTLRLLKDTLSLIKEYDWHLEYSENETDYHNKVAVWEQNHSGEIRNKKEWIVGNTTMYIDYGSDETIIYVGRRKYRFDLKKNEKAFINLVSEYYDNGNIIIYVDSTGLGKYICDLLDSHDISYRLIRNMCDRK